MKTFRNFSLVLIVVALLLASLFAGCKQTMQGTTNFTDIEVRNAEVTGDMTVGDTLEVTGLFTPTGGISGFFSSTVDSLIVNDYFTSTGTIVQGIDGTSQDVTLYSDTAGDYFLWDQSEEALTIIGTSGADALNIDDGNVDIADNIDVGGTSQFSGIMNVDANGDFDSLSTLAIDSDSFWDSTGSVQINDNANVTGTLTVAGIITATGGLVAGAPITVGTDGTSFDAMFYSDTAGDYLLWDQSDEALTIIGTNGADALNIDDGNVDIADNVDIDGTTDIGGNLTLQALLLASFANETISDSEWLTPTVTVYALDSAGAVGMTLGATGVEGQILILIGDDANAITIADVNIRSSDGNAIILNQYDVVMFVYQDAEWIEMLLLANS